MSNLEGEKKYNFKNIPLSFAIILTAAAVFGALYFEERLKLEDVASNSVNYRLAAGSGDTTDWLTFKNTELGVEFKYPQELGTPQTYVKDHTKSASAANSGKAIEVYFRRPDGTFSLAFGGHSSDYKDEYFRGFTDNQDISSLCTDQFSYSSDGKVCKRIKFPGGDAVFENEPWEIKGQISLGTKIYFNNAVNQEYPGLEFYAALVGVNSSLESFYGNSSASAADAQLLAHSKNIMTGENLSSSDKQMLDILDKILSTFKFTPLEN